MSDPQTSNILLSVPVRGSDVGTWDTPVNGDFTAIDGLFGGVATVGLTNSNVTLTFPSGTPSASPGPTQAQNAAIKFTGTLTANVVVTLPLPGYIILDNQTTGNFTVSFRAAGSGNVVATPHGSRMHVYNDGSNVSFVDNALPGSLVFLAGVSALPSWMSACTVSPYLIADGSIYNFSSYGALGAYLAGTFGGNGITTFGVPDLRGRVPLAYDGTGTRITTAGCGINGQTMGASGGEQVHTLVTSELAAHNHGITDLGHFHYMLPNHNASIFVPDNGGLGNAGLANEGLESSNIQQTQTATTNITINNAGGGGAHNNVQPAQVAGLWAVKT